MLRKGPFYLGETVSLKQKISLENKKNSQTNCCSIIALINYSWLSNTGFIGELNRANIRTIHSHNNIFCLESKVPLRKQDRF
jgi:hypothetical protein